DQWSLKGEKLIHATQLVQEQLQTGHIVRSNSPWNTPIFVIPKKSGKWRLLHDLRAINAVMQLMGSLQPGISNPTLLPADWNLFIIHLKDWFFTIPLHPENCEHFAFSVPSINNAQPVDRYHWTVLPQGTMTSPTICQMCIAAVLAPARQHNWPNAIIYHYMDDILVSAKEQTYIDQTLERLLIALQAHGLQIAKEKIQSMPPQKYLWWVLSERHVKPQTLKLNAKISTLNDVQKLLGAINWVCPMLGLANQQLCNLFSLLKGDSDR
ncbi:POK8 protein, partial [Oceanites oceanicus]|nr:POK8 protein [Oceanites oceanicus]